MARFVTSNTASEDWMKDIDFTRAHIRARWQAGYALRGACSICRRGPEPPLARGIDGFDGKTT